MLQVTRIECTVDAPSLQNLNAGRSIEIALAGTTFVFHGVNGAAPSNGHYARGGEIFCTECPKSFRTVKLMQTHRSRTHPDRAGVKRRRQFTEAQSRAILAKRHPGESDYQLGKRVGIVSTVIARWARVYGKRVAKP